MSSSCMRYGSILLKNRSFIFIYSIVALWLPVNDNAEVAVSVRTIVQFS